MYTTLEISLRYVNRGVIAINDSMNLEQTSSNTFSLPEFDEWDSEDVESYEQLIDDIEFALKSAGVPADEYWVE